MRSTTLPTPLGPFSLLTTEDGILAAGFTAAPAALTAELPPPWRGRDPVPAEAPEPYASALAAYFEGRVEAIDTLPVVQSGNGFHKAAWQAMRKVPPGTTVSYRQLAESAGNPSAARAAGAACAGNLIPLIVPCHRIRRSDGTLGGYYYGLAVKRWLLDHERSASGR
ncbi:methylated-DNA--[protein]-cysteine S-methyltransferase [Streptomyces rectiverticillatus]|uniref:methylated-DNA--[protein]-cysteine S-methyltransferase n=1 Tax=Streptomyces rectiverticillatus TaxID=173860 RepID=UPI0015C2E494|nr:methylated-DNA--[protein]-cysteine S-methyltransferase [Streptomyces rectiverticillatus]QLE75324.1 methylated-DNA--[protein]-cysteine S-methyltransferase [Streptomyces rectiverticillatus]